MRFMMLLRMIYENIQRQKEINKALTKINDVDGRARDVMDQLQKQLDNELEKEKKLIALIEAQM